MDKVKKHIIPEVLCMIEPRMTSYSGHLYNYASSLKKICEKKNLIFKILVSKECDPKICKELNASVVFENNPNQKYFKNIFSKFFISTFIFNNHLYQGLKKIYNETNQKWILFMGTTQYIDLFAIFIFNLFVKQKPKIILTLRMSIYRYDIKRWSITVLLYKIGFFLLFMINKISKNIYFITDSEMLKTEYEKISFFKIHVLPIPHTLNNHSSTELINNVNKTINIVSLGPARSQKGFSFISDLVYKFVTENQFSKLNFILQCNNTNLENSIEKSLLRLKKLNNQNINFLTSDLSESDYFSLLENADIILLPYNSKFYHVQTSGIFTEALSAGKIVIVSDNTWMSFQLNKFNSGLVFKENDFDSFYLKFTEALNNYDTLNKQSKNTRIIWNKYHNADNFVKSLLNLN
jgi:glycosyltransferase involved in cell wall biosynthesis